jgi:23S rRNA pseudouridine2605 synthase
VPPKEIARKVGLARAVSKLGYCSRSQAAELIRAGRVHLNGGVRRNPETPVRLGRDQILVDEHVVASKEKIYLMVNKPRGLVTTTSDEKRRKTIYEVFANAGESLPWVAPIGRLDKASQGLLLLTNDSEWGARIAAPETHLEKTYHVQIDRVVDEKFTHALVIGVRGEDGELLRASSARLLRAGAKNCWLEITLDEGKNRQIRRTLAGLGVDVLRLVRVSIGSVQLGNLAKGDWRPLTTEERLSLDRAIAKIATDVRLRPSKA